ncbi:MAG: GAF domain-containing protein [Anaerolineae bacterium]|nr:GAF domain-containing protein [Anaerolineae bacterium]
MMLRSNQTYGSPTAARDKVRIVIPLLVGEQVLGVLDIQSNQKAAFSTENLNIFTTLASQAAISLQNARQYEQTQTALEELSSLQRVITGESWETYMSGRRHVVQGYVANRQVVRPIMNQMEEGETAVTTSPMLLSQAVLADADDFIAPVQVRGTTIGKLGVRSVKGAPISAETQSLLTAISQQVAEALERARLFAETELARAQTDQLFAGSERVVRANTLDEVLQALISSTSLQQMDRVNLMFFDKPWGDEPPQTMTIAALWEKSGQSPRSPVGTVYKVAETPFISLAQNNMATIVHDIMTDARMDVATRTLLKGLGTTGLAVFPMVVGREWLGVMTCHVHDKLDMSDGAIRQISSLVDQAATVAQTQRLFEAAQARAQQEQILRRVSERVYSAVDAESVLRTAVQEVGRALGLEAFVYLDDPATAVGTAVSDTSPLTEKATNGTAGSHISEIGKVQ